MGCAQMHQTVCLAETPGANPHHHSDRKNSDSDSGFHAKYLLVQKLGKGAFAKVYTVQAMQELHTGERSGTKLAAKITDLRVGSNGQPSDRIGQRSKKAVEKEVQVLRGLGIQHNCVRYYESFIEGCFSYVIMEKCDYTLLQALERAPDVTETLYFKIFRDMLKALAVIHTLRVVHRDVKPDNFLCVGTDCTVKLCDFGLAEVMSDHNVSLSGIYGTAPFMSPEMLASHGYNEKTDIWAFGVVAYVLCYGQFPYTPTESSAKAMKAAILAGVPDPPYRLKATLGFEKPSAISANLKSFIRSLLFRDPAPRLCADEALAHQWMQRFKSGEHPTDQLPSLRPILYAAKRVGAFDVRNIQDDKSGDMDHMLHTKQVRFHGENAIFCGSRKTRDKPGGPDGIHQRRNHCTNSGNSDRLSAQETATSPDRQPLDAPQVKKTDNADVGSSGVTLSTGTGSLGTSRRSKPDS